MPNYRRNYTQNSTYFFTLCLANRQSNLLIEKIDLLRLAYKKIGQKMPFYTEGIVILPNHIHMLWTLPENDIDYSTRIRLFKTYFSKPLDLSKQPQNLSQANKLESGIWQRRFWEHTIQDEQDFINHMNYIHFNPVKHGWVRNVCDWENSSFHREVALGRYPNDWGSQNLNFGKVNFGE